MKITLMQNSELITVIYGEDSPFTVKEVAEQYTIAAIDSGEFNATDSVVVQTSTGRAFVLPMGEA